MSSFDLSSFKNTIMQKLNELVPKKVNSMAKRLVDLIIYDAKVEKIDVSQLMYTIEQSSDEQWSIKLLMGALTEEQGQYVKDHYYHNGLVRLGWC